MITLSPTAKKYLQDSLITSPIGTLGIRIGLRDAGCSGFAYTIDFTTEELSEDKVFTFDNVKIFVTEKHMSMLDGMEIDFVTQGVNSVLQFNNPNVINSCGCGESFQFKS